MTTTSPPYSQPPADRFGRAVAARLAAGTSGLPYEVQERLRAARVQALAHRKRAPTVQLAPAAVLAGAGVGDVSDTSWWNRIASAVPIIALAAGLVFIHSALGDRRASELAEVDAALLTDDLPPSAYADPGFVQFMKSGRE
jgi:hypothetical protein